MAFSCCFWTGLCTACDRDMGLKGARESRKAVLEDFFCTGYSSCTLRMARLRNEQPLRFGLGIPVDLIVCFSATGFSQEKLEPRHPPMALEYRR